MDFLSWLDRAGRCAIPKRPATQGFTPVVREPTRKSGALGDYAGWIDVLVDDVVVLLDL